MKRFMPDTVFGRLFGLVVLAVLASHILVFAVFINLAPGGPSAERPAHCVRTERRLLTGFIVRRHRHP